jgi:hypothetical protein
MIKVWTSGAEAGRLDRFGPRGSAFAYSPDVGAERAISLTMPVRLASWDTQFGLAPIFEMNLPEGALCEGPDARRFDPLARRQAPADVWRNPRDWRPQTGSRHP